MTSPNTAASPSLSVLIARLAGSQVGFATEAVREIVRSVAIAPLPGAPAVIEGAINLHGRIVPVVDVRQRLGLPSVGNAPEQFLVVLRAIERLIAVRVDDVEDVIDVERSDLEAPSQLSPVLQRLAGVAAVDSGALVVYDLEAFLTQAEREALDLADAVPA